jgi:hypothetical protein
MVDVGDEFLDGAIAVSGVIGEYFAVSANNKEMRDG